MGETPTKNEEKEEISDEEDEKESDKGYNKNKCLEVDKKNGLLQIKCETRKLFSHPHDKFHILPQGSVRIIINGKSGTGKSFILRSIIPMLHKPTHIFICTTILGNDIHTGIEKYCKAARIKFHLHLEPEEFMEDFGKVILKKNKDDHIICIFDDFSDGKTGKDNAYNNCTIRAFSKYRNYNVSCIILSPCPTDCKTNVRNSANIRILFPVKNSHGALQLKLDLREEFPNLPKETFQEMYNYICNHRFTFLMWCDSLDGEFCPHLRLNFDKIIWKQDSHLNNANDIVDDKKEGGGIEYVDKNVDRRTLNHNHGATLVKRHKIINECVQHGLPIYMRLPITMKQGERFLEYVKKYKIETWKGKHDDLMKIIGDSEASQKVIMRRLKRAIKNYANTDKHEYWYAIDSCCKEMLAKNYVDKQYLKELLTKHGVIEPDSD